VAKGIGILLVVLGHNIAFEQDTCAAHFIYSFHMPLFFFLAGLFHDESRSFFSHVTLKAKSLLLPCVLAFAAFIVVQAILVPDLFSQTFRSLWINTLYGTGQTFFWGQLWFLTSLFITSCACHLILRSSLLNQNAFRSMFALSLVPAGMILKEWIPPLHSIIIGETNYIVCEVGLPWNIDLLHITAGFYLLGTAFPKQRFGGQSLKLPWYLLATACAFALVGMGVYVMDLGMDLNYRRYNHWAGSTLIAICGILGVLLLSLAIDKLPHRGTAKAMTFIGKRSLFILVLHFSLQHNSFAKMIAGGAPWLASTIGSFLIGVSVPLVASLIWERMRKKTFLQNKPTS